MKRIIGRKGAYMNGDDAMSIVPEVAGNALPGRFTCDDQSLGMLQSS